MFTVEREMISQVAKALVMTKNQCNSVKLTLFLFYLTYLLSGAKGCSASENKRLSSLFIA